MIKIPQIGDIVMSPHGKMKDETGTDVFDLLGCDGAVIDMTLHPKTYTVGIESAPIYKSVLTTEETSMQDVLRVGDFYWVATNNYLITILNLDGTLTGNTINIGTGSQTSMTSIAVNGDFIYIGGHSPRGVTKHNLDGSFISRFATDGDDGGQINMTIKDDNTIAIMMKVGGVVRLREYVNEVFFRTIGGTFPANTTCIRYINGNYFIGDWGTHYIRVISPETGDELYNFDGMGSMNGITLSGDEIIVGTDTLFYTFTLPIRRLPSVTAKDVRTPYKIVADLT